MKFFLLFTTGAADESQKHKTARVSRTWDFLTLCSFTCPVASTFSIPAPGNLKDFYHGPDQFYRHKGTEDYNTINFVLSELNSPYAKDHWANAALRLNSGDCTAMAPPKRAARTSTHHMSITCSAASLPVRMQSESPIPV